MVHFCEFLKTWSLRSNSVTRQVNFKIGQKLVENDKIQKFKCDILSNFQTMWNHFNLQFPTLLKQSNIPFFHWASVILKWRFFKSGKRRWEQFSKTWLTEMFPKITMRTCLSSYLVYTYVKKPDDTPTFYIIRIENSGN